MRVPSAIERLGVFTAHTKIPVVVVRLEFEEDSESVIDGRSRREVLAPGIGYVDAELRGSTTPLKLRISGPGEGIP